MRRQPDVLHLALPCEGRTGYEIDRVDAGAVPQTELPERHLEVGSLRVAGIEVDGDQDEVAPVVGELAVVENVVVPRIVEAQIRELAQGSVLAAHPVQEADVVLDMPGPVHVPLAELVLLGVQILLAARHGRRLANLEAVIHAVIGAERRCEGEAHAVGGTPPLLQVGWVDVGRVDEEVGPHDVRHVLPTGQLAR